MSQFDATAFADQVGSWNLRYFKPYEFLVLGGRNGDEQSPAFGKNTYPPDALWPRMIATAQVLDNFRELIGAPVRITNAYRSPAYNKAIGGASASLHMQFNALDFVVEGGSRPTQWARVLRAMRSEQGLFKGGVGLYPTFVHVDTRGNNADW